MTSAQIDAIYNKLDDIGRGDLADQFRNSPDSFDFSVLENDPNFTDKYKSMAEFLGDKNKIIESLYFDLDGKMPTKSRMESIKNKHPEISEEDIKNWFDKVNEAKEYYTRQTEEESDRYKRAQEVRDWDPLKKILTSDYEKQRYIENPKEALFGKDAPEFGKAEKTRTGALGDLLSGATAVGLDLVPPVSLPAIAAAIAGGPLVRTARDVIHRNFSPYKKEVGDIIKENIGDLTFNASTIGLLNYRKFGRILGGLTTEPALRELERQQIASGVKKFNSASINTMSDLENTVRGLPDSPLKEELLSKIELGRKKGVDISEIRDIVGRYSEYSNPEYIKNLRETTESLEDLKKMKEGSLVNLSNTPEPNEWVSKASSYRTPTRSDKIGALLSRGADKLVRGYPGQVLAMTGKNVGGSFVKSTASADEYLKEKYKNELADQWAAGFVPRKQNGDPKWEAYKEWAIENGIEPDDKAYGRWEKILGGSK